MKNRGLLLTGFLSMSVLAGNAATIGFEDQQTVGVPSWGISSNTIVANPYKCGNESDYCNKLDINSYGLINYWLDGDWTGKLVAVDVFAYSDETVKGYACDKDIFLSVKARKWTTLYYDYTSTGSMPTSGANIGIGGLSSGAGTIYVDNIRLVDAKEAEYDCDAAPVSMDVEYKYGRLAIGGGGFVSGLLYDANTGVKMARTDVGGAYMWNASDCEWKQMFDFVSQPNVGLLSVESFAVDPQNGNNLYFLCGNGYLSGQKTSVLYSNDGGSTFKETELTTFPFFVHGNGEGRNNGERIAVDPNNSKIIIAGSRIGTPLVMSTDGAKTFSTISSFPDIYTSKVTWPSWGSSQYATTENQNGISAVVFDGNSKLANGNTARIFVGVSRTGATNVYVSEDGGATWSAVSTLPTTYMPLRMKMAQDGNLYISYANKCVGGSNGAIYRYNPSTGEAKDITPETGYSFGDVEVSPRDVNKLIVSTNNTWIPQNWDNGTSANGDYFWVSSDGGATWKKLAQNYTITNNGVTWVPGYAIHWCGSMCFDPNNENQVSFASGNGIFSCLNPWEDKPTFYFDVNGVEETVALDFISIPGGSPLSVIGDYTGFKHDKVNEFAPIHKPAPGSSYGIAYAAENTKVVARVAGNEWGDLKDYLSEDGGSTWTEMSSSLSAQKIALSADGSTIVAVSQDGALSYSTNKGVSFTNSTCSGTVTYVIGDPVNSNYFYAAGKDKFYVSADGGKTFTGSDMTNDEYTRLCVVPGKEGLIYAPCGGSGLFVSTDHGATFSKIAGLNGCQAIGEGISEDGTSYYLYAWATSDVHTGIFRSADKGASWQIINDSKHQFGGIGNGKFVVGDNNVAGRFYMSTVGMGIVYGDLPSQFESPVWKCFEGVNTTGVETVANEMVDVNVVANPNPFSNTFSMNESGNYKVYNTLGSVVESGVYTEGAQLGSKWNKGIYFVKINENVIKVIKR